MAETLSSLPSWVPVAYSGLLGLCIGSFLNVVALRLPRGASLLGRSRCPACRNAIRWFDNIPVASYVLLGARCRACRARIHWRYPAVEALTALTWAAAAWRYGATAETLWAGAFASLLIALAVIDLDHMAVPDALTVPVVIIGLLSALLGSRTGVVDAALAAIGAATLFGAIVVLSRGGMGVGDVLIAAGLGANLGLWKTAVAVWVAAVAGGLTAAALLLARRVKRGQAIPYGPFLALGGIVAKLAWP